MLIFLDVRIKVLYCLPSKTIYLLTYLFSSNFQSLSVMQYSAVDLYNGIYGDIPVIDLTTVLYVILGVGIVLKFVLWVYCLRLNKTLKSDTVSKFKYVRLMIVGGWIPQFFVHLMHSFDFPFWMWTVTSY